MDKRDLSQMVQGPTFLSLTAWQQVSEKRSKNSKSDHLAEISGKIVRYNALAPRPEVLRSNLSSYANKVYWVLFRRRKFPRINLFDPFSKTEKWQFSLIFQNLVINHKFRVSVALFVLGTVYAEKSCPGQEGPHPAESTS